MDLSETVVLYSAALFPFLLLIYVWKRTYTRGRLPPGPTPLPFIGNLLQIDTKDMAASLKTMSEKYGPVFTVSLGPHRVVVLWGYDAVKEALITRAEEFSGRGALPQFDKVFKGYGFLSNGERWKHSRRFTLTTLRNFGMGKRTIEERIQEEAQFLVQKITNTKELSFDPTLFLTHAISNVICSIVFGDRFDYQDQQFLALLQLINDTFKAISSTWGKLYSMFPEAMDYLPGPHNKIFRGLEELQMFVEKRIKHNQETLDPNFSRDLIDEYLIKMEQEKGNAESEFHQHNLVFIVLGLFFGGTESASRTLRHGLIFLLRYPDIQDRIHKEIEHVIGQNRRPALEDRSKMPYTDAVINEIQRFSDIFPLGVSHKVLQDTKFRGFIIPKDMEVVPVISSALNDPLRFDTPQEFNPKHFLNEDGTLKKNDAFIPFSAGKRICPGEALVRMELFLFLATILQNFSLKPLVEPKEIDINPVITGFGTIPPQYQLCAMPRK